MGIKDLTAFLKEFAPRTISKGNLSQIKNDIYGENPPNRKLRAAIDTSLFLYKYKYRAGDNFINEFMEQINRLMVNNIQPIYVFDGPPTADKQDTINSRKEKKQNMVSKMNEIESKLKNTDQKLDIEQITLLKQELIKIKRKSIFITSEDIRRLIYFLDIMNIPHVKRNMEADLVCSRLSQLGIVDVVISEDMDHLTSGTSILLRDFNNKNNYVTVYNSNIAITDLSISNEKWIELCILFGCDYVPRIRGLGYKTSWKYISDNKHTNITDIFHIILENKRYTLPEKYMDKFNRAKTIFENTGEIELCESDIFQNQEIFDNQIDIVKDYLSKYTHFTEQKIKNRLKNIFGYCI